MILFVLPDYTTAMLTPGKFSKNIRLSGTRNFFCFLLFTIDCPYSLFRLSLSTIYYRLPLLSYCFLSFGYLLFTIDYRLSLFSLSSLTIYYSLSTIDCPYSLFRLSLSTIHYRLFTVFTLSTALSLSATAPSRPSQQAARRNPGYTGSSPRGYAY
ncbi:MAG: hypothetical protein A4E64_00973 [Syntrophorhabdus sp. PtaU1.Bin058]|nr:MAG: hypothetical protein A4E64_00973 [Syntrophorhabdus sp. PtaU1.Bin058]